MKVVPARPEHFEQLCQLFDQYRVFYEQPPDLEATQAFLRERFRKSDSVVFVAVADQSVIGFTQLYPSFSSTLMKRLWILNDLFVRQEFRKQGVGRSLLNKAAEFGREMGAVRLVLATQISNTTAQALYESLGYKKDEVFYHYALQL